MERVCVSSTGRQAGPLFFSTAISDLLWGIPRLIGLWGAPRHLTLEIDTALQNCVFLRNIWFSFICPFLFFFNLLLPSREPKNNNNDKKLII
jgi:hypothetical protein